jgi:hypothetical protein
MEHPFPTQPTTLQGKSLPSRTRIILAARTVKLLAMAVWGFSYDGGTQNMDGLEWSIMEHLSLKWMIFWG